MEHIGLVDSIYLKIKQMIFNQELKPGQKLLQEKLSAELGVSRSPFLKALQRLEAEFLVENLPRRGMYVKVMSREEIIDTFQCRSVLEGLSARLAAKNISSSEVTELENLFVEFVDQDEIDQKEYAKSDRAFHKRLMDIGGNKIVKKLELINNIHLQAFQVGLLKPPKETLTDHFGIINALKAKNGRQAELLMREHIESSLEVYESQSLLTESA